MGFEIKIYTEQMFIIEHSYFNWYFTYQQNNRYLIYSLNSSNLTIYVSTKIGT